MKPSTENIKQINELLTRFGYTIKEYRTSTDVVNPEAGKPELELITLTEIKTKWHRNDDDIVSVVEIFANSLGNTEVSDIVDIKSYDKGLQRISIYLQCFKLDEQACVGLFDWSHFREHFKVDLRNIKIDDIIY